MEEDEVELRRTEAPRPTRAMVRDYLMDIKKLLEAIEYPIRNYGVEGRMMRRLRRDAGRTWAWA